MSNPPAATAPAPATPPRRTSTALGIRLVAMMLLEFIVFGSWFATFGLVLATHGLAGSIATAYMLAAVAAIVSPMFIGALGDRFFASQKVFGIAHLLGGLVMLALPGLVASGRGAVVLAVIFVYTLLFQPTVALSNSITFHHLAENGRLFPYVREFGTLGWAVGGLIVGQLGLSASPHLFTVTAVASFITGVYAFTLPNTPPAAKGAKFSFGDVIGARAFVLFRHRNFVVFFVCVFLTAISLGVYNTYGATYLGALGIKNVASVMTLGQVSELIFILFIPWALKHFGMKWSLLAGMGMWGIRYLLFFAATGGQTWPAVAAVCLHGICNDFFMIIGAMYIDDVAPLQIRAQAQSLLFLAISGIGALLGSFLGGQVYSAKVAPHLALGAAAWHPLWWLPLAAAIVTGVLWIGLFRFDRRQGVVRWSLDDRAVTA